MKLRSTVCKLLGTALVVGAFAVPQVQAQTVDVTSIVKHPALDAVAKGAHDELVAQGFTKAKGLKWKFQTAQQNNAIAAQIARQYVGENPDVILAISTPSAQAIVATTKKIPVVYSAVTDPVAAQLVPSWGPSGTNVTGVSDVLPLDREIDLIKKVVPDAKTIGMVFNPGETNSVSVAKKLKKLLAKRGMKLVESSAVRTVDVGQATNALVGKVDAIYTNTDNNVTAAYEALVRVADRADIPVIAGDPSSVARGAAASYGVSYYNLGRQTGAIIARILKGEKPGDIASEKSKKLELVVNPEAAKAQGVTLSKNLIESADKVVKTKG